MSISVNKVVKRYENGVLAINNVSLDFGETGLVAIVGASGSGKSTLLNILSCNDECTRGSLRLDNEDYSSNTMDDMAKKFSYIYQDFKLINNLTVYQNVTIGYELSNSKLKHDDILKIIDRLGLSKQLNQKVLALSGGQQQRVAIARALVRNPRVIFADEPTGNLDSKNSANVFNILKEVSKEYLIILVTHDIEKIKYWADRIIKMHDGCVVEDYMIDQSNYEPQEVSFDEEELLVNALDIDSQDNVKADEKIRVNKKPKNRAKPGLSASSSWELAIAFNNKRKLKRIAMVFLSIVIIGFVFFSSSLAFSTAGKSMLSVMKSTGDYNTKYSIYSDKYPNLLQKMEKYMNDEHGIKSAYMYSNLPYMTLNTDESKVPIYYEPLSDTTSIVTIITDNPADQNLDIVVGRKPVAKNEIAISKYMYDYILNMKSFELRLNSSETIQMVFRSEEDIIGKDIEYFSKVITGVFDDKLRLDTKYKQYSADNVKSNGLLDMTEEEYFQAKEIVSKEIGYSYISKAIIRPMSAVPDINNYAGIDSSGYQFTWDPESVDSKNFVSYLPCNQDVIKQYKLKYNIVDQESSDIKLEEGEFLLASSSEHYINKNLGREIKKGDKVKLDYLLTNPSLMGGVTIEKRYESEEFTFKGFARIPSNTIIINQEDYNRINRATKDARYGYFNDPNITYSALDDIIKYSSTLTNAKLGEPDGLSFEFRESENINDAIVLINILKKYVALPVLILFSIMLSIMIMIYFSDIVKGKANDLLILKSLGAKQKDMLKIFSVHSIVIFVIEVILGIVSGYLAIYLSNLVIVLGAVQYGSSNLVILRFDWEIATVAILIVAIINLVSIVSNLLLLRGKNLRKAFQKTKE